MLLIRIRGDIIYYIFADIKSYFSPGIIKLLNLPYKMSRLYMDSVKKLELSAKQNLLSSVIA